MSHSDPCRLLDLSAELRLDIYLHLVIDCLSSGSPTGLAGLLFSCRSIQQELQAEFGKIGPLLHAQSEWNKQSRSDPEAHQQPLRLQLAHQLLTRNARPADLTVVLPILRSWLFVNNSGAYFQSEHLEDKPLFMSLIANLQRVFDLPWSVLTINFCKMAYMPKISFSLTAAVSEAFFIRIWNGGVPQFNHVDRLVLNYGSGKDVVNEGQFQALFRSFFSVWRHSEPSIVPMPVRGWIARVKEGRLDEQGWKVVFDFKEGLGMVDGALWEIASEDGLWKPMRLFEGDLDEVVADERWEREYDTDGKKWGSSGDEGEDDDDDDDDDDDEVDEDGDDEDEEEELH